MELLNGFVLIYILVNVFICGYYVASDAQFIDSKLKRVAMFLLYLFFGVPFFILLMIYALLDGLWSNILFPEIRFYYRIYFATYYEDLIKDDLRKGNKDIFKDLERIANRHTGLVKRRFIRHTNLIKKRHQHLIKTNHSHEAFS